MDEAVLSFLNEHARRWPAFDRIVVHVALNDLFKGVVAVSTLCWLWWSGRNAEERARRRSLLVATVVATFIALAVNRTMASLLPHRPRPLQATSLEFIAPAGMRPQAFSDLSSFPSDHAVLFVSLALGAFLVSRRAGTFLALHAALIVLLPRLYLGLHYLTDLLAGAALGVVLVWLMTRSRPREKLGGIAARWSERHPPSFHAVLFLAGFGLATLLDPAVRLATFLQRLLGGAPG